MATSPDLYRHLSSGAPVEVHGVYCAGPGAPAVPCGYTVVVCDDYELAHPLDGGGFVPVSGECVTCGIRLEFCARVHADKLRIPSGPLPASDSPPDPSPSSPQEIPGGDDEPDVPE